MSLFGYFLLILLCIIIKIISSVYDKKLSLSKGDYKVKLQIVNESYDVLDKTKALPMSMDFALEGTEADVGLDFYWGMFVLHGKDILTFSDWQCFRVSDHVDALSNVAATFTGTRVFPGEVSYIFSVLKIPDIIS